MKPDPLKLLKREFFSGPVGRVERSAGPAQREATDDAVLLAETLDDAGTAITDDAVLAAGRYLGWTPEQTLAAARTALRSGLLEAWTDDD